MTAAEYWLAASGLAIATAAGVALLLKPLIVWLRRRAVWDVPNARSSHSEMTPRGGGIAVIIGIVLAAAIWLSVVPDMLAGLALTGAAMLAAVSWIDDRRNGGLPARVRLAAQALAILAVLMFLPAEMRILGDWLPLWLERLACFLAWLWFTNLFNFMDGINGITGLEMVSIGIGIAVTIAASGLAGSGAGLGLIVAGAGLGFLPWNWNRAKVFLGDVGSVPAGFLIGWLLLDMALKGHWAAALILPMYYWLDATATLLRRLFNGERVWEAHRSHFYQQGARKLGSHVQVARRIAILNLGLICLALAAVAGWPLDGAALLAGLAAAALLCRHFANAAKPVV